MNDNKSVQLFKPYIVFRILFYKLMVHCKNEFVILTDHLLPQLHLHFQYIVRNMKYEDN